MYFPKPYPDEVLGGVAGRAARHLGLPFRTLVRQVLMRPDANLSFFLPADLRRWALLTEQSPQTLLLNHTPFPYWSAFRSEEETQRLMRALTEPRTPIDAQFVRWSGRLRFTRLRICPECVSADLREYRESYWHRSHFLPTVPICPIHQVLLLEDPFPWSDRRAFRLLPQDLQGIASGGQGLRPSLSAALTEASVRTLSDCWMKRGDWSEVYRNRATVLGYVSARAQMAGTQMAADLEMLYGAPFLRALGSHWAPPLMRAWPALMLARRIGTAFSPAKHVLLQTFFSLSSGPGQRATKRTGPKPPDMAELDLAIAHRFQQRWEAARSAGVRLTVRAILESLQIRSAVRNNRGQLPRTVALMRAFRKSNEWQPGGKRPTTSNAQIDR